MSKEKDLLDDCEGNCIERILTGVPQDFTSDEQESEMYYHLVMPMEDYVEYLDPDAFEDKEYNTGEEA